MNRVCPKCGDEGSVFINHDDFMAVECIVCRIAWNEHRDGSWKLIVAQDADTLEVMTGDSLVVWDEVQAG